MGFKAGLVGALGLVNQRSGSAEVVDSPNAVASGALRLGQVGPREHHLPPVGQAPVLGWGQGTAAAAIDVDSSIAEPTAHVPDRPHSWPKMNFFLDPGQVTLRLIRLSMWERHQRPDAPAR